MIKIHEDKTRCTPGHKFYAITDRGFIYGSSIEIVQRKIKRLNAKEKVYKKETNNANEDDFELPF